LFTTAGTVVCDRNSIMQSLLNNPKNPYTGLEMKIEDCEECPELKKKIEDWLKSRHQET
jgi:ABC-type lipoprotein release transport system permease subunit